MAVSEPDRRELYRSLEGAIGEKPTGTLMTMLERATREDWATKQDSAELRTEFAELRTEFAEHRAETREQIAALRVELHGALRGQLLAFIAVISLFNGMTLAVLKLF